MHCSWLRGCCFVQLGERCILRIFRSLRLPRPPSQPTARTPGMRGTVHRSTCLHLTASTQSQHSAAVTHTCAMCMHTRPADTRAERVVLNKPYLDNIPPRKLCNRYKSLDQDQAICLGQCSAAARSATPRLGLLHNTHNTVTLPCLNV